MISFILPSDLIGNNSLFPQRKIISSVDAPIQSKNISLDNRERDSVSPIINRVQVGSLEELIREEAWLENSIRARVQVFNVFLLISSRLNLNAFNC